MASGQKYTLPALPYAYDVSLLVFCFFWTNSGVKVEPRESETAAVPVSRWRSRLIMHLISAQHGNRVSSHRSATQC